MYHRHILFPYQRKSSENLLSFAASNLLSPVDYTPNYPNTLPFSPYFLMKFIICACMLIKLCYLDPTFPSRYCSCISSLHFMKIFPESIPKVLAPLSIVYITECEQETAKLYNPVQAGFFLKIQRNQRSNFQAPFDHPKKLENYRQKKNTSASLTILMPLTV